MKLVLTAEDRLGRDRGFHLWLREHGIEPNDTSEVEVETEGKYGTIKATVGCRDSKGKLILHPYIENEFAHRIIEKVITSDLPLEIPGRWIVGVVAGRGKS